MDKVLVIDNGSCEIKLGYADQPCFHVRNALMRSRDRRFWLANAVELCKELTGLQYKRPIEKGQLYSWELQKAVWDWIWDTHKIVDDLDEFKTSTLLLTEAPGTLPQLSSNTDQVVFEEFEFANYRRVLPQVLAANGTKSTAQAQLVVDVGFNATHVVPVLDQVNAVARAIKRLDVGGKLLTNYLKEVISYRHYNMMEETEIVNRIKERTCQVSSDFAQDIENWHAKFLKKGYSSYARGYSLPMTHEEPYGKLLTDFNEALAAQKKGEEQVLILDNEKFTVPEALFDPRGHVGLNQAPLPETIHNSILRAPEEYQAVLWSNIVLCGGSAAIPNLKNRLENELRQWAPSDVPVNVFTSANYSETAWAGGCDLQNRINLNEFTVSRESYLEMGQAALQRVFASSNKWSVNGK